MTQGIDGYLQRFSSQYTHAAKAAVELLLGNLNTKIFHQNTSASMNDYATKLLGKT